MKEPKVSLELAKLLKEKGFKEEVRHLYFQEELEEDGQLSNWNKVGADHISAPTIAIAIEWVYYLTKIYLSIRPRAFKEQKIRWDYTYTIYTDLKGTKDYPFIGEINKEKVLNNNLIYILKNYENI
jgi:hypothetical protein